MIAQEFLVELEKIRDSFQWKLLSERRWELGRRSRPRLRFRGICKYGPDDFLFEPIGAVCYVRTGQRFAPEAWLEAATAIELSLIDASNLIAAANDRGWVDASDGRKPSEYLQRLRRRMAACVELELSV